MTESIHGGNIWVYSEDLLDFSANLHPLGMPPSVREAAQQAVCDAVHYPDPNCTQLRHALSEKEGVNPAHILCGNGAADLIFRLCLALKPRRAILLAPTFAEYEQALTSVGCAISYKILEPTMNFSLSQTFLPPAGTDLIFLCNPNNPTGQAIPPEQLESIVAHCFKLGCFVVIDECFLELTDLPPCTHLMETYSNVLLLRAFTKSYGMAGLRLGYLLSQNEALLHLISEMGQPWAVSTVAQAAGLAACQCSSWAEQGRNIIRQQRPVLQDALRELGFCVWDSAANYILFQAIGNQHLKEQLLKHKILIRSCGNYRGLSNDFYRVCVNTPSRNQQLLTALSAIQNP